MLVLELVSVGSRLCLVLRLVASGLWLGLESVAQTSVAQTVCRSKVWRLICYIYYTVY